MHLRTTCQILLLASIVLVAFPVSRAQQQLSTVDELRRQIALFTKIDRDPATPPEIKQTNRVLLQNRKAELQKLLSDQLASLKAYKNTVDEFLKPDERQELQKKIDDASAELLSLAQDKPFEPATREVAPRELAVNQVERDAEKIDRSITAAVPGTGILLLQNACPATSDAVITDVYVRAPKGATPFLIIDTADPISVTQDPPVALIPSPIGSPMVRIPKDRIEITMSHGSITRILADDEYAPGETLPGLNRKRIRIMLAHAPDPNDTDVKVRLINLKFDCDDANGHTPTLIAAPVKSGTIYNEKAFNDRRKKEYDDAVAAAKSPDRKAFSAGFSAAKSESNNAQGAGDIVINKDFLKKDLQQTILGLFDQAALSFIMKKTTATGVDPRHVSVGINFRRTFLIDLPTKPATFSVAAPNPDNQMQSISTAVTKARNKGFFRVVGVGGGLKLEGEAFDFKTVNFVTDPSLEIGSIAKRIGSHGYYNVSLIGGTELGRNLSKPDPSAATPASALSTVSWIARFMGGGQATLRYLPSDDTGANWGIEGNIIYAYRHLFHNEVFTDTTSGSKAITIGKGDKSWTEANLKVFLFGDEKARYGFRVSYSKGGLPPAFTPTRGFQYGFVIETTDDKTNGQPANKQP